MLSTWGFLFLGSRSDLFHSLVDRVNKKLKDWKSRSLSYAGGKLTLVKSVAQAILTYLMTCFKIPNNIISKIEALIIMFLWGQKTSQRRIHWLRKEWLCRPKYEGSLGLRILQGSIGHCLLWLD